MVGLDPLPNIDYRHRTSISDITICSLSAALLGGIYNGCRGAYRVRPMLPYFNHGFVAFGLFAFPLLSLREIYYYATVYTQNKLNLKLIKDKSNNSYDPWKAIDKDEMIASSLSGATVGGFIMLREGVKHNLSPSQCLVKTLHGSFVLGLGVSIIQLSYSVWRNYRMDSAIRWHLRSRRLPDTEERKKLMETGVSFDLIMQGKGATSSSLTSGGAIGFTPLKFDQKTAENAINPEVAIIRQELSEKGLLSNGDFIEKTEKWLSKQFIAVFGAERALNNVFIRALDPEYRDTLRKKFSKLEQDVLNIQYDIDFLYDELEVERRVKNTKAINESYDIETDQDYLDAVKKI